MLIRKSMIETYVRCPMLCKFRFIDYPDSEEPGQFAAMGTRFHEWANAFFTMANAYHPEQWDRLIPYSFSDEERNWAYWFIQLERRRWNVLREAGRLDEWKPIYRELTLESSELGLHGTIDRVDWHNKRNETVTIIEYKTSQHIDLQSLRRQLAFYKLLYEHADQFTIGTIKQFVVINPRIRRVIIEEPKQASIDAVLRWIERIRDSMRTGVWPVAKNDYICMWCEFVEMCPKWR